MQGEHKCDKTDTKGPSGSRAIQDTSYQGDHVENTSSFGDHFGRFVSCHPSLAIHDNNFLVEGMRLL
jgi:hypothetical protein